MRRGAGGTDGGVGAFIIAFIMICAGGYMLLQGIIVRPNFHFGTSLFAFGRVSVTSGMVMVPFIFGIGLVFYNARSWIGWGLAVGSVAALVFGVISSTQVQLVRMTAFELLVILVLLVGGIGLMFRSLRPMRIV